MVWKRLCDLQFMLSYRWPAPLMCRLGVPKRIAILRYTPVYYDTTLGKISNYWKFTI